jgi:hypothetical protein
MTEKAAESILFRARREFRERMESPSQPDASRNGKRSKPLEPGPEEAAAEENAGHKSL